MTRLPVASSSRDREKAAEGGLRATRAGVTRKCYRTGQSGHDGNKMAKLYS